jgi:hypothetical protein|eukprot:SAG25_NODE_211_length_11820_cov_9.700793_6_plen_67_part_00
MRDVHDLIYAVSWPSKLACGLAEKQREDRCEVFQWARALDPPRCAYWVVAECPNMRNGKQCDRIHE